MQRTRTASAAPRNAVAVAVRILAVIAADQVTKSASQHLDGQTAAVTPVRNPGLSLQLVDTSRWVETAAMTVVLLIAAAVLGPRVRRGTLSPAVVALLLGGAASNLLDRAVTGSVRDFLPIGPVVINVADLAVLTGLVLVAVATVRNGLVGQANHHTPKEGGEPRCPHRSEPGWLPLPPAPSGRSSS